MRKILVLLGVLVLAAAMTMVAFAGGRSNVAYTWTVADLGQGIWGGGPLFADGGTGGNFAFSAGNGQLIFHYHATGWTEVVPGALVNICFTLHQIKGTSPFPPSMCVDLPVFGTPIIIPNPDVCPTCEVLIRVTPAN